MAEYCNPLDLNYKYQHYGKSAHREGADPTLVYFKGKAAFTQWSKYRRRFLWKEI